MNPLKNMHITCAYGWRTHPIYKDKRFHHGVDLRAAMKTEIYAIADGKIISVKNDSGYGLSIKVDHGGGVVSFYAHLSAWKVNLGDTVAAGQVIALSGSTGLSTGPHLHFGVYVDGIAVDPLEHELVKGENKLEEITIRKEGKTYKGFLIDGIAYGAVRELFTSQGQDVIWRDSEREAVVTTGPLEKLREVKMIVEGVK